MHHETGHGKHHRQDVGAYLAADRAWTAAEQEVAARVSRRAEQSPREFVAEVYAARALGVSFDEGVIRLYNALGGPGS
jgi:hypothetical protein